MQKKYLISFVFLLASTVTTSCYRENLKSKSFVQAVEVKTIDKKASVAPDKTSSRSIQVKATLDKNAVLNQEFFYSANLQYSSIYDKHDDLYTQSLAQGLIPVHFRIAGNELDLIADNRDQFPSDVNHPERLISRFQILSQTDTTLTISEGNSSVYLAGIANSDSKGVGPANLKATETSTMISPQEHWVRSFEFAAEGQYLLQESSVDIGTDQIVEFMEAIFPRENMKASDSFKVYQMNPDSPAGGTEGYVARYRFLNTDRIFNGESKLAFAEHFDLPSEQATIDWYVTPNIPDEDLAPVGLAVEGWNRYFRNFKAMHRDILKFKGRLPQGIHLGDPRYNVINWDSRLVAGAAYESQSYDPSNGKQANAIIYMPAAWIKIGMDYWANGEFSEIGEAQAAAQSRSSRLKSVCFRDMHEAAAYLASGKLRVRSEEDLKNFGIELLKQTLFHEVGHALGLAHNFKGSLSYKPNDSSSIFSTSIMDYNDFEIERVAFEKIDSSSGPQLEYDRQALSVLYNNAQDVASSDPVLPTCNDAEADNEAGGVDPLCTRYDIEHDPSASILTAVNRIYQSSLPADVRHDITLSEAILQIPKTILSAQTLANIKTKSDFEHLVQKISSSLDGALNYYLSTGRSSLGYATRTNLKMLYKFGGQALPSDYDPQIMRERVYSGVTEILKLNTLPAGVLSALSKAVETSLEAVKLTPYLSALETSESNQVLVDQQDKMNAHVQSFSKDQKLGLPAMRTKMLTAMARHPAVPFFFGKFDKTQVDYEMLILIQLSDVLTAKDRTSTERLAAAKSLASFSGRKLGDDVIAKAVLSLSAERDASDNSDSRDLAESLLKALSSPVESTANLLLTN